MSTNDSTAFPPDTDLNLARAAWAQLALQRYAARAGLALADNDDIIEALGGLLADLRIFADVRQLDYDQIAANAHGHYLEATREERQERRARGHVPPVSIHDLDERVEMHRASELTPIRNLAVQAGAEADAISRRSHSGDVNDEGYQELDRLRGAQGAYEQALRLLLAADPTPTPALPTQVLIVIEGTDLPAMVERSQALYALRVTQGEGAEDTPAIAELIAARQADEDSLIAAALNAIEDYGDTRDPDGWGIVVSETGFTAEELTAKIKPLVEQKLTARTFPAALYRQIGAEGIIVGITSELAATIAAQPQRFALLLCEHEEQA